MLATLVAEPFDQPGWIFEEKYDGDRMLAYKEGHRVRLLSRNGIDRTTKYPTIARAISRLPAKMLVLDGEIVVFDKHGVSRFQLLQQGEGTPVYAMFDCLYCNGFDLRHKPLKDRQAKLRASFKKGKATRLARRLNANGLKAFREARQRGFEGLVAKNLTSPYVGGRSRYWLKIKVHQEDEFLIVGYTKPTGARKHFGALLLAAYDKRKLRYAGKVGTGFSEKTLSSLYAKFQPLATKHLVLSDPPREKGVAYLRPRLVAQISFQELTADKKLRQPVYLGLRDDKRPQDVTFPLPKSR